MVEIIGQPALDTTDFQLYVAIRRISELVCEFAAANRKRLSMPPAKVADPKDHGVNPYYSQTQSGLFLEWHYSGPGYIWTPWGKWTIPTDCMGWSQELEQDFLSRLGVTLHQPLVANRMGQFGPVYAVDRVGDMVLPKAKAKRLRTEYLSYEDALMQWEQLVHQYCDFRGEQRPIPTETRWTMDQLILETRGKHEPRFSSEDILSLEALIQFGGRIVKYSKDQGRTWHYTLLWKGDPVCFSEGTRGIPSDEEVLPHTQVHCRSSITERDFKKGIIIRPATEEEVRGIKFSYPDARPF